LLPFLGREGGEEVDGARGMEWAVDPWKVSTIWAAGVAKTAISVPKGAGHSSL